MKMVSYFLFALLICATKSQIKDFPLQKCEDHQSDLNPAFSLDFCRSTLYDTTKYRCCYYQYESADEVTHYQCKLLTMAEFADIDDTIDKIEADGTIDVEKLDCHSSYLYASLLLILALIF